MGNLEVAAERPVANSGRCSFWAVGGVFAALLLTFVVYVASGGLTIHHGDCGLLLENSVKHKVCVEMPQVQRTRRLRRELSSGFKSSNNTVELRCKAGSESTCSTAPGGDCTPEKLYIVRFQTLCENHANVRT